MSDTTLNITLPYKWRPRDYQMNFWNYMENGGTRAAICWPRRHGKDEVALNWIACAAMQRVGTYWYCLPESAQSRKAIWDAVNEFTGVRRIDGAFPPAIRQTTRNQDMHIQFINGSTLTFVGSDNYDSLVGSPPVGIVFSEFALANPNSWGYLRPILANNGGWAIFISTPRGRNHFYTMFNMAKSSDDWFAELLTVDDTQLLSPEKLKVELEEYIAIYGQEEGYAKYRQEYYCSFEGNMSGSYYGALLDQAEADGRITSVPYDPALPVITSWDLGMGDASGIWFFQKVHNELRAIDYYETSGEGLSYYAKLLKEKPYVYDTHIMPHDIKVRELGTGKSRYEIAASLGIRPITVAKALPVDDGINAVRSILPRMWFDERKCSQGLEYLRNYRKEYDEKRKEYKNKPYHDYTSHCADALRIFAIAGDITRPPVKPVTSTYQTLMRGGFGI